MTNRENISISLSLFKKEKSGGFFVKDLTEGKSNEIISWLYQ